MVSFVFFWYVWPTPYRLYKLDNSTERENRFTGVVQTLTPDGWLTHKQIEKAEAQEAQVEAKAEAQEEAQAEAKADAEATKESQAEAADNLTPSTISALQSSSSLDINAGMMELNIYNPTTINLINLKVYITFFSSANLKNSAYSFSGYCTPDTNDTFYCTDNHGISRSEISSYTIISGE